MNPHDMDGIDYDTVLLTFNGLSIRFPFIFGKSSLCIVLFHLLYKIVPV